MKYFYDGNEMRLRRLAQSLIASSIKLRRVEESNIVSEVKRLLKSRLFTPHAKAQRIFKNTPAVITEAIKALIIAESDGVPIGWSLIYYPYMERHPNIWVFVSTKWRGQSIGSKLVKKIKEKGISYDYTESQYNTEFWEKQKINRPLNRTLTGPESVEKFMKTYHWLRGTE
jgi:GNAT superfamily N-acetyltransferase